jgi:FMN phosphatase YigB (HAD superfamily)
VLTSGLYRILACSTCSSAKPGRANPLSIIRAPHGLSWSGIRLPEFAPIPGRFSISCIGVSGSPDTWQVYEDVFPALKRLRALGLRLAVISNWDERLRPLLDGLGLAQYFDQIVVSIDAGSTKPAPQIFAHTLERLNLEPNQVLHVGDSEEEDFIGPAALGIPALLLRRGSSKTGESHLLSSLVELNSLFQGR